MKLAGLFDQRVRGFRIVELGGLGVLLALVLAVYLSKTGAGGERADIDHVQQQIQDEQTRIRLLQARAVSILMATIMARELAVDVGDHSRLRGARKIIGGNDLIAQSRESASLAGAAGRRERRQSRTAGAEAARGNSRSHQRTHHVFGSLLAEEHVRGLSPAAVSMANQFNSRTSVQRLGILQQRLNHMGIRR